MDKTTSGIHKVGVIGLGLMGSGIAQVAATRGFNVLALDVTEEIVKNGLGRIEENLSRSIRDQAKLSGRSRLGLSPQEKEKILKRLQGSTDPRRLIDRDIVIEAMIEDEAVKKKMISTIAQMGYQSLWVSNTSSISITRLASAYPWPEKFMGMHFMNPVSVQPGCELICGSSTSDETFYRISAFCRELGKQPIFAKDRPGFGINRMFVPFLMEAVKVVQEGTMSCEDADKTTLCLGHKMGPITTLDYVGLDTALAIAGVLERDLGPSYKAPDLLAKLVTAGFHGLKSGKGFYIWDKGKNVGVNPAVERYCLR